MKQYLRNLGVLCGVLGVWSCGSDSSESGASANSAGSWSSSGRGSNLSATGGRNSIGWAGSATTPAGLGGSTTNPPGQGGSAANSLGGWATGYGGTGPCEPEDMSGFSYPTYKPARHLGGSCTAQAVADYYTNCYLAGNCAAFRTGGAQAACGACLAPTDLGASAYGPLLILGSGANFLYETNMAGCIELEGEADCAARLQVAALCEYHACAASCPITDSASYQRQMDCMMSARFSACSSAENAAACIRDPAHVTACSGGGFQGQFLAVAQVFCVESH